MLLRTGGQGHPTPIHILASISHTQTYKKVSKTFQLNDPRPIDGLTGGLTDRLTDGQSLLKSCVTKTKALQMIFRLIFSQAYFIRFCLILDSNHFHNHLLAKKVLLALNLI